MENFWLAAAGAVGQAIAQEVISRTVTSVLGKRKEKASQGDYVERLEAAVRCMHSVLEKTAKAPITEVSLLRDRNELVQGYMEAKGVLYKHTKRQARQEDQQQQEEMTTQDQHQAQGTSVARRTAVFSIASSFIGPIKAELPRLSCDDIERFERLAGSAKDFLGVVSRCAWLRHRIYFSGPVVSHLFQREALTHKILEGSREHHFRIWSIILEGRGVEAELQYICADNERPDKIFWLQLQLRLSPSTDIAQVAIKCLQSLAVNVKLGLLLEPATGALLQLTSSQDIVSHAPRWRDPQWASHEERYMDNTRFYRQNAVCCTAAYGYDNEPYANESQMFPEEVISLGVHCCISGLELTLPSPSDTTGATVSRDQSTPPGLLIMFIPHYMTHVMVCNLRKTVDVIFEGQEGVAVDRIERQYIGPIECRIQEADQKEIGEDLFRMDFNEFSIMAFEGFFKYFSEGRLPISYSVSWFSKHGAAFFRAHDAVRYAFFKRRGLL